MVTIRVPIRPIPFARAGSRGKVRFTPRRQADFMAQFRLFAAEAMAGRDLLEGPLEMTARFVYEIPKSWSKAKRANSKWKVSTPDYDNLAKLCGDSLNCVVWHDDAQVASARIEKVYGDRAEVIVTVRELEQ